MEWIQIIFLALLQGITEFLPISSSAHLILAPYLFSWTDQGIAFDVAVHLGTLIAVVTYFRRQLLDMVKSIFSTDTGDRQNQQLIVHLLIATIPVVVVGGIFHDEIATYLRSPLVIAATTVIFGLALLWANFSKAVAVSEYQINYKIVILIGLAQVLALIPGTSRSGVTMTAAVMLGMSQTAAARFSFLLAIPVILGSAAYEMTGLIKQSAPVAWVELIIAVLVAAISAYLCIHYFLKLIERIGFTPFVIYRLLLGAVLIIIFV